MKKTKTCPICAKSFPVSQLFPLAALRPALLAEIEKKHPNLDHGDYICKADLSKHRMHYVQNLLVAEKGKLTELEVGVVESIKDHELMSKRVQDDYEETLSFGEKLADKIAVFGGSWTFLISFFSFLLIWIGVNAVVFLMKPFDPYPFILLNLILSCLAATQAPIIMMSQNRQEAKDRVHAEHDYQINLKAELEIRHLHEKMDHLLKQQWERLVEIQQVQIELLHELADQNKG